MNKTNIMKNKNIRTISIKKKSKTGVLVIHGFSGTPLSLEPLINSLEKKGFNIEAPLLKGHGTKWEDSINVKYADWTDDVESSFMKLKKRVKNIFVAGLSMGGTLALQLAQSHEDIKGIILINHAIFINDLRLFFNPLFKFFIPSAKGIAGDIKKPKTKEIAYDYVSSKASDELVKLIKEVKANMSCVDQPLLIFKSKTDHVIKIKSVFYTIKKVSSGKIEIFYLNDSYHVATLDNDSGFISKKTIEFIEKNQNI